MPPALAKDLAYSSLRNERHTPAPPLPPNGPSPSMPVNISLNIECRNTASKSVAWVRALALASSAGWAGDAASEPGSVGLMLGVRPVFTFADAAASEAVAVCAARAGIVAISHHLDVGLDGAVRLHCLQDGDHVERADAERVEPVDQLL